MSIQFGFLTSSLFSNNNQAARVSACKGLKKLFNAKGMDFMASNYLVEDESWFLWDAPENRRAWIQKNAVKPTIAKQKLTERKTVVLIAFTCKPNIFSVTVLPKGEFVDAQFIINYLKDTQQPQQSSSWTGGWSAWSASHPTVLT